MILLGVGSAPVFTSPHRKARHADRPHGTASQTSTSPHTYHRYQGPPDWCFPAAQKKSDPTVSSEFAGDSPAKWTLKSRTYVHTSICVNM